MTCAAWVSEVKQKKREKPGTSWFGLCEWCFKIRWGSQNRFAYYEMVVVMWFLRRAHEWKQHITCKRALGWFKSQHFKTRISNQHVLNRWCRRVVTDLNHDFSPLFSGSLTQPHHRHSLATDSICSRIADCSLGNGLQLASSLHADLLTIWR